MTTIVRVKRHRGEDPVDALVLSCKRKKTNESGDFNTDSVEKILNFSGTVEEKDDKIAKNTVDSFTRESKFSKTHVPDIKGKQRKEQKERSDGSRFTLLSCLRSSNNPENYEAAPGENVTIVDVSKKVEENVEEDSYVYDLYSTQFESDSDFDELDMNTLLSVQPLDCEFTYKNGEDIYDEADPDEDDSNDENNWRNDYPDTDPEMEECEDADILARQLKRCGLDGDTYSLSDDDDEEKYLNCENEDDYYFFEGNESIGNRYANYMAKSKKELMDEEETDGNDDIDDDECNSQENSFDSDLMSFHENSN